MQMNIKHFTLAPLLVLQSLPRSPVLQGSLKEKQRLNRAQGARLRLSSEWPCAHMLLLPRRSGETQMTSYWLVCQRPSVDPLSALLSVCCWGVILKDLE